MKKNLVKRVLAVATAAVMTVGALAGCGSSTDGSADSSVAATDGAAEAGTEAAAENTAVAAGEGGTIMWLSNLSSGIQYETSNAYLSALCEAMGYDFTIVYGDAYNDAAGNLSAVKNGMTNDVVGIIASQDGGLASIMEEYPEVYVAGYNTDMNSVFGEGGENAAVLENDHFLGTICDQTANGEDVAQRYFDVVLEKGYHKVAVINFPSYAYPALGVGAETFTTLVEDYNATAADADKIEIVGETTTLEFAPLEDSWFLEDGHNDLDCIIAMCAGIQFVYPTLANAIGNGTCSADTKLITAGFDTDATIVSDIGDDKIMTFVSISPAEDPAYALVLLDNAINGCQYADFEVERLDSAAYKISSTEDIDNVMSKSMAGTADVSLAQISVDEVLNLCVRNNPDATYAGLKELFLDESVIGTEALKNR